MDETLNDLVTGNIKGSTLSDMSHFAAVGPKLRRQKRSTEKGPEHIIRGDKPMGL